MVQTFAQGLVQANRGQRCTLSVRCSAEKKNGFKSGVASLLATGLIATSFAGAVPALAGEVYNFEPVKQSIFSPNADKEVKKQKKTVVAETVSSSSSGTSDRMKNRKVYRYEEQMALAALPDCYGPCKDADYYELDLVKRGIDLQEPTYWMVYSFPVTVVALATIYFIASKVDPGWNDHFKNTIIKDVFKEGIGNEVTYKDSFPIILPSELEAMGQKKPAPAPSAEKYPPAFRLPERVRNMEG